MSKIKKVLIVLFFLCLIFFLKYFFNDYKIKSTNFITQIKSNSKYTIQRITNKGLCNHNCYEYSTPEEIKEYFKIINPKKSINGSIYLDTLKNTIWTQTSEYIEPKDDGLIYYIHTEWINFNLTGKILNTVENGNFKKAPGVILENEITNFYNWDNKSSNFYVNDFIRQSFNWNCLNPFSGYGNPNSDGNSDIWEGYVFFNLKINKKNLIQFKSIANSTTYGYSFNMEFYHLPKTKKLNEEIILIYFDPISDSYEDISSKGLYLIKSKS
ncbi:hypothetical protein [Flavobacterium sp.]|uniref:hypothetical protein n=1 Tax=Flavobacterium sp. TaxID=239 RepID=UPI00286E82F2|nr:hypothetical protein [Flavobacterium sp.]